MRSTTWLSLAVLALIACSTVRADDFVFDGLNEEADTAASATPGEDKTFATDALDEQADMGDLQMDDDFHQKFISSVAPADETTADVEKHDELECGRLQIRKNGKCVDLQTCPEGQYRIGKVCKRLPATKTCEAEYNAIVERKRKEDPLREKEMAVIYTIREIISKMNGVENIDEKTGLSVKNLLPLLETASDEERKHAEVTGEGGVSELIAKLEEHLIEDQKKAEKEVKDLFNHCVEICIKKIKLRKKIVRDWEETKRKMEETIKAKRAEIAKEEGILAEMKKQYKYDWDVYLKTRSLREKENALIGWIRKKVEQVAAVKEEKPTANLELSQSQIDSILDGLDADDTQMAKVVMLLQRDHVELDTVFKLLDGILAENVQAEKDDVERLRLFRERIAAQERKIAKLKEQLKVLLENLEEIKRQLAIARANLEETQRECANFGADPID